MLFQGLMPSEESVSEYSLSERRQIPYIVKTNLAVTLCFALLFVVLIIGNMKLVGIGSIIPLGIMISAIIMLKRGKLYKGSSFITLGLLLGIAMICFVAPTYNSNLVLYRQAFFIVVMCIINMLISYKPKQIVFFSVGSVVLWGLSLGTKYLYLFSRDGAMMNAIVNTLAIVVSNLVIINFKKLTRNLMNGFEETSKTTQEALEKITAVVNESKAGLNIGQQLQDSTRIAQDGAEHIEELHNFLEGEAKNLNSQAQKLNAAGLKVVEQADRMRNSLNLQTASISGVSTQMEMMAESISSINSIAETQKAGVNKTLASLEAQQKLLKKLVEQVEKVKISSDLIGEMVKTINSVSNQTNLLAMNASIEAAHAGIAGKGFGVISQEIRKLSEETARSAARINETLEDNHEIVRETTESVDEFADYAKNSTQEMTDTMKAIEDILAGINDMDFGTKEVLNSLKTVVAKADENMKIVETVNHEVRGQGNAINEVSNFSNILLNRVNELDDSVQHIQTAIETIKGHAEANQQVAEKINGVIV